MRTGKRKNDEMNPADMEALLADVAAGISYAQVEVGAEQVRRYKKPFLKLTSRQNPEQYAIISMTGSGWYGLTVTGGFCTGVADDQGMDYASVREHVETFVRAATAYLDGHWSMRKSKVLRVPTLTIQTEAARLNLVPRGHWSTNSGPSF
jgi:hypothetical protein